MDVRRVPMDDLTLPQFIGGVVQISNGEGPQRLQLRGTITRADRNRHGWIILGWEEVDCSHGDGDWQPYETARDVFPDVRIRNDMPLYEDGRGCYYQVMSAFDYYVFTAGATAEDLIDDFVLPRP